MDLAIDPALLAEASSLPAMIAGADGETLTDAAEAAIFDAVMGANTSTPSSLDGNGLEFVRLLSTIDVIRNTTISKSSASQQQILLQTYAGNSRDVPTLLMLTCKNSPGGCTYTTAHDLSMETH